MMMRLTGSSRRRIRLERGCWQAVRRAEKPCLLLWNGLFCWRNFQAALEAEQRVDFMQDKRRKNG